MIPSPIRGERKARGSILPAGRFDSGAPHQRTGMIRRKARLCLPARLRTPRQKNPALFRFPGLRKGIATREKRATIKACRESCTAAVSFFLSNTDPLRWALCSAENGKRRPAAGSGLTQGTGGGSHPARTTDPHRHASRASVSLYAGGSDLLSQGSGAEDLPGCGTFHCLYPPQPGTGLETRYSACRNLSGFPTGSGPREITPGGEQRRTKNTQHRSARRRPRLTPA